MITRLHRRLLAALSLLVLAAGVVLVSAEISNTEALRQTLAEARAAKEELENPATPDYRRGFALQQLMEAVTKFTDLRYPSPEERRVFFDCVEQAHKQRGLDERLGQSPSTKFGKWWADRDSLRSTRACFRRKSRISTSRPARGGSTKGLAGTRPSSTRCGRSSSVGATTIYGAPCAGRRATTNSMPPSATSSESSGCVATTMSFSSVTGKPARCCFLM